MISYVAQAGFQLATLLSQPSKGEDYRCVTLLESRNNPIDDYLCQVGIFY